MSSDFDSLVDIGALSVAKLPIISLDLRCPLLTDFSPIISLAPSLTALNLDGFLRHNVVDEDTVDLDGNSGRSALIPLAERQVAGIRDLMVHLNNLQRLCLGSWVGIALPDILHHVDEGPDQGSGLSNVPERAQQGQQRQRLPALHSLSVSRCPAVSDLRALSGWSLLTSLDLSHCPRITDISPLASLPCLVSLDLECCEGLADLSPLSSARGFPSLTDLDLVGCSVTDLHPVASCATLKHLNLSKATAAGVEVECEFLRRPGLKITRRKLPP